MPECAAILSEVVLPAPPDVPEQGRKMAIRIGVAFMVLMFVNVGIGLYFIFWHESKNPNRPLLEAQMREQIAKSIERAAALTPAPNALGVTEITIPAETGKLEPVADEWLQLFSGLEDLPRKVFPTRAALAFLSIYRQIGNLNFARRSRPLGEKGRGRPPPELRRTGRPRLQARRRASSCRSWKSQSEIGLTVSPATLSF